MAFLNIRSFAFRGVNRALAVFQPLAVEVEAVPLEFAEKEVGIQVNVNIYEKRTGRGAPFAPFTLYINGISSLSDQTDANGKYSAYLSFIDSGTYFVDVYVLRMEAGRAFGSAIFYVFNIDFRAYADSLQINSSISLNDKKFTTPIKILFPALDRSETIELNFPNEIMIDGVVYPFNKIEEMV